MLMAAEDFKDTSDFNHLYDRLVIESITSPDVIGTFNRIIPKARGLISNFFDGLKTLDISSRENYKGMDSVYAKVLKNASSVNFLAYKDLLVSVPEGFQGKLIPYLQFLNNAGRLNTKLGLEAVKSYNVELSAFLSNSEIRTSLFAHNALYDKIRNERMSQQKALSVFFKNGSTLSRRPLGSLIDRFGELEVCFRTATSLESVRTEQTYKTLLDEIKRSVELLDLIQKRASEGSVDKISGPMAKHLANGAYEIASYVENTVLYGYHLEVVISTVRNMAEQLQGIFQAK